jgi:hypothetical protein
MALPHPITQTPAPDAGNCPLCGHANQCAMERQRETGITQEPCWCTTATFAPALLERVAPQDRNRACICARCAAQAAPGGEPA